MLNTFESNDLQSNNALAETVIPNKKHKTLSCL